jgi:vanillate O-demethylase ferredoxin subunit
MWSLQPGARIDVSSPASLFEIDWSRQSWCLIAGGIGITRSSASPALMPQRRRGDALRGDTRATPRFSTTDLLGDRLIVHAGDGRRIDLDHGGRLPPDAMARLRRCALVRHAAARHRPNAQDLRYGPGQRVVADRPFRVRIDATGQRSGENKSMLDALGEAGFSVRDCQRGDAASARSTSSRWRAIDLRRVLQRSPEAANKSALRVARRRRRYREYALGATPASAFFSLPPRSVGRSK